MEEKFKSILEDFKKLTEEIANPSIIKDKTAYQKLIKAHSSLIPIVENIKKYNKLIESIKEAEEIMNTETELKELAKEEKENLEKELEKIKIELANQIIPKEPLDSKNIIMEIRAGIGGEEACIFASDLFRMYLRFIEKKGWKAEIFDVHYSDLNGIKEVIFGVKGENVYSVLKYEKGVHRVQRVPITESQGRIHTSAVTVAVLPEPEPTEIDINENDLKIDCYRASGHGGQNVQKTSTAVRITHLPTGIVVTCQDERSQHQNKAKALRVLKARLLNIEEEKKREKIIKERKAQVGTGDRSEKIRTYNFPQNRVTDHRIGLSLYKLDIILNGELDEIIEKLKSKEINELLESTG